MSDDPATWNDIYRAEAVRLAHEVRRRRYTNFMPSYQEKLLLADALIDNEKLRRSLARMVAAFRPFTLRPIGGQGSTVRLEQEEQVAAHAEASALSSQDRGTA